ncbi:hypothetical protein ABVK25_000948 [Lepraria finkii]|uniref:Uncharacterized protein n=1 Tax=Lepraria finkii TaxID=1340010 RepID=A0ABR4BPL0_9LECA
MSRSSKDTTIGKGGNHREKDTGASEPYGHSQPDSEAAQYLPGGLKYWESVANAHNNPRNGKPMSQWISEWEGTWDDDDPTIQASSHNNLSELEADPAIFCGNGSRGPGQPSKGVNGIKVRLGLRKEVV